MRGQKNNLRGDLKTWPAFDIAQHVEVVAKVLKPPLLQLLLVLVLVGSMAEIRPCRHRPLHAETGAMESRKGHAAKHRPCVLRTVRRRQMPCARGLQLHVGADLDLAASDDAPR